MARGQRLLRFVSPENTIFWSTQTESICPLWKRLPANRWFIEREHLNKPVEIIYELEQHFTTRHRGFFPIPVPATFCNLCIRLTIRPKAPSEQ